MPNTKQKILTRLGDLIIQISDLMKERHDSQKADLWKKRVIKLLERMGGEKLVGKFHSAGAFSFTMYPSEGELQEYYLKQISAWHNFLITLKEDLELFDDIDEPELSKIKHKFEIGANVGILKGKYSQEKEK